MDSISFIKCDVEGHELSVIEGANSFLFKSYAAWLIEISSNPDENNSPASKLISIMNQHGYMIYFYNGKALQKYRKGDKNVNYFFLKKDHLKILEEKGLDIIE